MTQKHKILNKRVIVWPSWEKIVVSMEDRECIGDAHFSVWGGHW